MPSRSPHAPDSFTLQANASPVVLTTDRDARDLYAANAVATLTLNGAGFSASTTVALVASNGTTIYPASSVNFDTFSQLTATVNLSGVPQGVYSIRVSNGGAAATPSRPASR